MKKGGKLLGQGSYGCVFDPPIKCTGETNKRDGVGKVMKTRHVQGEIDMNNMLLKIDPTGEFTNPMLSSDCKVLKKSITNKDESNNINRICEVTDTLDMNKEYSQILYKYKGKDLLHVRDLDVMHMMNVIYGVLTLQKNNLCHRDIKEGNILAIKDKYILIDFGISIELDKVYTKSENDFHMHDYVYYPPEFKIYAIMNYMMQHKEHSKTKEQLMMNVAKEMDSQYFKKEAYQHYSELFKAYRYKKNVKKDVHNAIERMVKDTFDMSEKQKKAYFTNLARYVDVFSIGHVLLFHCVFNDQVCIKSHKIFSKILERCLAFNVYERYSVEELFDDFKKLDYDVNLSRFTVQSLKDIARKNNLKVSGKKKDLYERLKAYL